MAAFELPNLAFLKRRPAQLYALSDQMPFWTAAAAAAAAAAVAGLSNDQDDEIGIVPPLAYFAIGGNYAIIRMMEAE